MNIRFQRWCNLLILLVLITSLGIAGCSSQQSNSTESPDNQATAESPIAPTPTENSNQTMKNYLPRLEGKATVVMTVNGSPITIEVNGNDAPVTAGNFVDLVERGVYDGLVFHRVVKEPQPFVAQGGDPQGKDPKFPVSRLGTGGFVDPKTSQPRYIPLEIKLEGQAEPNYNQGLGQQSGIPNPKVVLKHTRGAIAMARSQAPDSASSQFYFALSDLAFLDGDYAVFGYVTQGMEVVDKIKQGDRLDSAKVVAGSENLKK